jgi:hypothetical protein
MDMRFDTWNVRSMYKAGSLRTVAEDISKYKLDLKGELEVTWECTKICEVGPVSSLYPFFNTIIISIATIDNIS